VGWAALVQREREAAVAPLRHLRGQLLWGTWVTIAAVVVLTSALWAVLTWVRRRRLAAAGR
jgi:hypothetical protein